MIYKFKIPNNWYYSILIPLNLLNAAKDHIKMCYKVQKYTFKLDSSQQACAITRQSLHKNQYQPFNSFNDIKNEEFLMEE